MGRGPSENLKWMFHATFLDCLCRHDGIDPKPFAMRAPVFGVSLAFRLAGERAATASISSYSRIENFD
jgi:hypothetical protein